MCTFFLYTHISVFTLSNYHSASTETILEILLCQHYSHESFDVLVDSEIRKKSHLLVFFVSVFSRCDIYPTGGSNQF